MLSCIYISTHLFCDVCFQRPTSDISTGTSVEMVQAAMEEGRILDIILIFVVTLSIENFFFFLITCEEKKNEKTDFIF